MSKKPIRTPIILGQEIDSCPSFVSTDTYDTEHQQEQVLKMANSLVCPPNSVIENAYVRKFASLWALRYKTIKGKPTTFISTKSPFKHRPWQKEILDDTHDNKIIEKSRQLGLSEVGMTEVLHFMMVNNRVKCMYVFPRNHQMLDFSKSRIAPVFENNAYFSDKLDNSVNSTSIKKIMDSYLFMRSGWSGATGEGVDTDFVALDEYDRMKDGVELSFMEGLRSSQYGLLRRWSTPTIPGRGINELFQKSDQRRYIWKCEHCGHRQYLTFDDNVIQIKEHGVDKVSREVEDGTFIIGCKKCKKEINRMGLGEWVSIHPAIKEIRGYHISQLDAAWISADDIMRRMYTYSSKQLFYNYVLGEAHSPSGMLITDEDIRASIRLQGKVMSRSRDYVAVCAGIDWGATSYMILAGIRANGAVDVMNMFTVDDDPRQPLKSVSTFCAILRAYNPNIVVADAGYGADRNSYGFTQFPSAWYSCYFQTTIDPRAKIRFKDTYNEATREIAVDKTVRMQRTLHAIKGRLIGLYPWDESVAMLADHCKNVRIMEEEQNGIIYSRATRVGADHFACALAYALVGVDKLTNYNIKFNTGLEFEMI